MKRTIKVVAFLALSIVLLFGLGRSASAFNNIVSDSSWKSFDATTVHSSGWETVGCDDCIAPEPTTVLLLGICLVGLAVVEVRRRQKRKAFGIG